MRCQKTILQIGSFAMLLSYLFTMAQIIRSALKEDDSRLVPLKHDFVVNSPSPNLSTTQVLNATDPSWNAADGIQNKTSPPQFVPKIYQIGPWDLAPIVITEYKLLFFTQGKVRHKSGKFQPGYKKVLHHL